VKARIERSEAAGGWLAAGWQRSLDGFSGSSSPFSLGRHRRVALDGSVSRVREGRAGTGAGVEASLRPPAPSGCLLDDLVVVVFFKDRLACNPQMAGEDHVVTGVQVDVRVAGGRDLDVARALAVRALAEEGNQCPSGAARPVTKARSRSLA
jgi:hypothetical protein